MADFNALMQRAGEELPKGWSIRVTCCAGGKVDVHLIDPHGSTRYDYDYLGDADPGTVFASALERAKQFKDGTAYVLRPAAAAAAEVCTNADEVADQLADQMVVNLRENVGADRRRRETKVLGFKTGFCTDPFCLGCDATPAPPPGSCRRPPAGWYCSMTAGHDGPCPTYQVPRGVVDPVEWVNETYDSLSVRFAPPRSTTLNPNP